VEQRLDYSGGPAGNRGPSQAATSIIVVPNVGFSKAFCEPTYSPQVQHGLSMSCRGRNPVRNTPRIPFSRRDRHVK
jgi:hypothetical protein